MAICRDQIDYLSSPWAVPSSRRFDRAGEAGEAPQEQAFWRDYQHGLIWRMSKAELLDLYRLGIDLVKSFRFVPGFGGSGDQEEL